MPGDRQPRVMPHPYPEYADGNVLLVEGPWSPAHETTYERERCIGLRFFQRGTPRGGYECIEGLPRLMSLELYTQGRRNLSILPRLRGLKFLALDATQADPPLDCEALPHLQALLCDAGDGMSAIERCFSLKFLNLTGFAGAELASLSSLAALDRMMLTGAKLQALCGVEGLQQLTSLELVGCRTLEKIAALSGAPQLGSLEVTGSRRVTDWHVVGELQTLERIRLESCGEIPCLPHLDRLERLREFFLVEKTVVLDDSLAALLSAPRLQRARFAKRRHYSVTWQQVEAAAKSRQGG